jgi:class 3 adenylate cyclase/tetratricopeptide (TPR) repeat protein
MTSTTTVTILFSDLVNSTELLQHVGDEAAQRVFETHHRLLRDAVSAHGGAEVKWTGDGLMVAFDSATAAVRCAIAMQQAARRPAAGERLQIRVGLQVGEALRHDATDYFGTTVVVASRLCAPAKTGEILCAETVRALISDASAFDFRERGALALKGITAPVAVCEVLYEHDALAMLTVTPFVGRDDVIASLAENLEQARAGHGSLVTLVGEPGIGKTRTAEEFCDHARSRGATVLWGRCYDGEWAPPFSPFTEALREYARVAPSDELRGMVGPDAGVLARLVPEVREGLPDTPEPAPLQAEGERYRLLEAVSNSLGRLASIRPVVLVLDDLHWADDATIAMLRHVSREGRRQRLVLLCTYRDVELDDRHPLSAVLAALRRETVFQRVALAGLATAAVGELLDVIAEQSVSAELTHAIAEETAGNPFFLREVMLHLVEEKKIAREDGRWNLKFSVAEMGIPDGVREVIKRRLARLSGMCVRALTAASAMTSGFSWAELRAIAGGADAALLDALDEALSAQLLVEREDGNYDFTHALVRHTLYEGLNAPRRALLHRQVAETLERLYSAQLEPHLSELAHHFFLGGSEPEKTIEYCRLAADHAARQFTFHEAAFNYARAASLVASSTPLDRGTEAELLLARAQAIFWSGREDESLAAYVEAAAAARMASRPDLFVRAATRDNSTFGTRGEPFPTLLREALEMLPETDSAERAIVMSELGGTQDATTGLARDMTLVDQAVAMAKRVDDPEAIVMTIHTKCWAVLMGRDVEEVLALTDEFETFGLRAESASYWRLVALYRLGRVEEAEQALEEYQARAEALRLPQYQALWMFLFAMREAMKGNFDAARELTQRGSETGSGWEGFDGWFAAQTIARLWDEGRNPSQVMGGTVPANNEALTAIVSALVEAERGNRDDIRRIVESLPPDFYPKLTVNCIWLTTLTLFSEGCSAAADRERAAVLYELLQPHALRPITVGAHVSVFLGSAARSVGRLAAVLGRFEAAERHFEQALIDNTRWEARPALARTQLDYARMLFDRGGAGDGNRARELLDAALSTARKIGMANVAANCQSLRGEA